ncbi:MAG: IS3 family transposase [Anaerolineae bacterium]|nr:IS3 family transposase [Anaerolineae bacterium]
MAQKVALVNSVRNEYGVAPALRALGLPRSTWYYQTEKISYSQKYQHLRPILEEIGQQHPEYGIPRITAELQQRYQQPVNHKVVQRLLKQWDLSLLRSTPLPKPSGLRQVIVSSGDRANLVAQLEQIEPFAVAYTDFTEIPYAQGQRKAYLMPIIGHCCKLVYGWALGPNANTDLALKAWKKAKQTFKHYQIPIKGLIIHHDQDSVYTGYGWSGQLLREDKVRLSYALQGAKDNPAMESFNGRFKGEAPSLFLEAADLAQLQQTVDQRIRYYNTQRRHSSLDYQTPLTFLKQALAHKGVN